MVSLQKSITAFGKMNNEKEEQAEISYDSNETGVDKSNAMRHNGVVTQRVTMA